MKNLYKVTAIFYLTLLSLGCKKSSPSPDPVTSNQVTLTAVVSVNAGVNCKFDITDATTSDNPVLYTEDNITGNNTYTFKVSQARTLGMDFFVLNPKKNGAQIASISFSANGEKLGSFTVSDSSAPEYYTIIGTTP